MFVSSDITGPEALGLAEIAALAGRHWRTPLTYVNLSPGDYQLEMARAGLDPWWCYAFSTMFASVRQQRWAGVSGDVFRLTGRPPRPVRDLLTEAVSREQEDHADNPA